MDTKILVSPYAIGFYFATIFTIMALYHLFRSKGELSRYRRLLSDKLEIEADTMKKLKAELDGVRKENESLRVKVNALNELPERKVQRDLEIYARAEKRMLIGVPGFAPAWETAKGEAHHEMLEEEAGKSAPQRLFSRLFGGASAVNALPARDESRERSATVSAGDSDNGQHKD